MARSRKIIGVVLAVVLATLSVGVFALSSAGAETNNPHFRAKKGGKPEAATILGTSEPAEKSGTQVFQFGAKGPKVECTHTTINSSSATGLDETLSFKPEYFGNTKGTTEPECDDATTKKGATVKMEGCKFEAKLTVAVANTAEVEINCPTGEITIKTSTCTVKIGTQKSIKHILFTEKKTNGPPSGVDLVGSFAMEGITYKATPFIACGLPKETNTDGKLKGDVLFTAENSAEELLEFTTGNEKTP